MCLLTYLPDGILPDTEALTNGTTFNDDGHGYAIVDREGNRIITGRGMEAREMIEEFAVMRAFHPDGPALFHSRLATDGTISLLNCHPFTIGDDPRTVLAHNGIMPIRTPKGDPRSDTRIVAEDHIPRAFGTLRRRRARLAFERWLTTYNKVVILTVDRRFRENGFILNESAGTWANGIWYSNDAYLPYKYEGYGVYKATGDRLWALGPREVPTSAKHEDPCWHCGYLTDYTLDECPRCGTCFDCGEYWNACMCYIPSKAIDGPARGK